MSVFKKNDLDRLEKIITDVNDKISVFSEGESRNAVYSQLSIIKNKLSKIDKAKDIPASIGVFGQSQVGKTFLVSSLIGNDTPLNLNDPALTKYYIDFNQDHVDSETTAVVTRLTSKNNENTLPGKILLKMISLEDLIAIYLNGYFLEGEAYRKETSQDRLSQSMDEVKNILESEDLNHNEGQYSSQLLNGFKKECKKFNKHYRSNIKILDEFDTILSKVEYQDKNLSFVSLANLICYIWDNDPAISKAFKGHLNLLKSINYSETLYIDQTHLKQIICLQNKVEFDLDNISIPLQQNVIDMNITDKQKKNLQLIVKEVVMPFTVKEGDLLSKIDVLDFPGARSLGGALVENVTHKQFQGLFKRGKIKHFFDSYVESYDIEHLLLCTDRGNQEVVDLPLMVGEWYKSRDKKIKDKFHIIFTKSDLMLVGDSDDEGNNERINAKFINIYEEFDSGLALSKNWAESEQPFNNFYFIINHTPSNIYNTETHRIVDDHKKTLDKFKQSFLRNDMLKNIFNSNQIKEKFDESFLSESGGIEHLLNTLNNTIPNAEVASSEKMNYLNLQLKNLKIEILNLLAENGISPPASDIQEQKREVQEIVKLIGKKHTNLPTLIDNMIQDFPEHKTLKSLLVVDNANPFTEAQVDFDDVIEKFLKKWFKRIDDSKNLKIFANKSLIYNNFKKHIQLGLNNLLITEHKETLEQLDQTIDEGLKEKTIVLFLNWICGYYLLYLDNTTQQNPIQNVDEFNEAEAPFEAILQTWPDKLLSLYTDGEVAKLTTSEKFEDVFNDLNEVGKA